MLQVDGREVTAITGNGTNEGGRPKAMTGGVTNERIGFAVGTASPRWFQYDARGSTIRTNDTNDLLVDGPPSYTAFGQPTADSGYIRNAYRSEFMSGDLLYLRNRDYDPTTGQFTTPDALDGVDGTPTASIAYPYADNDPYNRSDPFGLRANDSNFRISTISEAELAYLTQQADLVVNDHVRGSIRVSTAGKCMAASGVIGAFMGAAAGGSGCIMVTSQEYGLLGPFEWTVLAGVVPGDSLKTTWGTGGAVTGGTILSNAWLLSDIGGYSICVWVAGGNQVAAEAEVCFSVRHLPNVSGLPSPVAWFETGLTGYWTIYLGAGLGGGAGVAVATASSRFTRLGDRRSINIGPFGTYDPVCIAFAIVPCPKAH